MIGETIQGRDLSSHRPMDIDLGKSDLPIIRAVVGVGDVVEKIDQHIDPLDLRPSTWRRSRTKYFRSSLLARRPEERCESHISPDVQLHPQAPERVCTRDVVMLWRFYSRFII